MRAKRYGLVISDWNMEPMTGYDLLQQVRADPGLGKTPFIMVTAESKTENVIAAKKAGVEQLHRQAVQRADAEGQDRSGVRREQATVAGRALSRLSDPSGSHHTRPRIIAFGSTPAAAKIAFSAAGIGRFAPAQFLGVDARSHEQAIDPERRGAFEIGAHRIADRQHARSGRRAAAAQRRGLGERRLVDRRDSGLPAIEHLAARGGIEVGNARPRNRPACRRARPRYPDWRRP